MIESSLRAPARVPVAMLIVLHGIVSVVSPGCTRVPVEGVVTFGSKGTSDGQFLEPRGLAAVESDGSIFVIDRSGRIQHLAESGELLAIWWLPDWKEGQPIDATITPWGTLLVGDTHYSRVLEYDTVGNLLRKFGEAVGMELVRGITVSPEGVIFVADYGTKDCIHRFARDGAYMGFFGSKGEGLDQFARPEGIVVGESGDLFVVDCGHHRIMRFSQDGDFLGSFGSAGKGPGEFLFPFDIDRGSDGTLFVVEFQGNRIQRFREDGTYLGSYGRAGRLPGEFATPRGVSLVRRVGADMIYVADTYNHRVQQFHWKGLE